MYSLKSDSKTIFASFLALASCFVGVLQAGVMVVQESVPTVGLENATTTTLSLVVDDPDQYILGIHAKFEGALVQSGESPLGSTPFGYNPACVATCGVDSHMLFNELDLTIPALGVRDTETMLTAAITHLHRALGEMPESIPVAQIVQLNDHLGTTEQASFWFHVDVQRKSGVNNEYAPKFVGWVGTPPSHIKLSYDSSLRSFSKQPFSNESKLPPGAETPIGSEEPISHVEPEETVAEPSTAIQPPTGIEDSEEPSSILPVIEPPADSELIAVSETIPDISTPLLVPIGIPGKRISTVEPMLIDINRTTDAPVDFVDFDSVPTSFVNQNTVYDVSSAGDLSPVRFRTTASFSENTEVPEPMGMTLIWLPLCWGSYLRVRGSAA